MGGESFGVVILHYTFILVKVSEFPSYRDSPLDPRMCVPMCTSSVPSSRAKYKMEFAINSVLISLIFDVIWTLC
jgi:hypothetical protein